jgi:hypothetical protein
VIEPWQNRIFLKPTLLIDGRSRGKAYLQTILFFLLPQKEHEIRMFFYEFLPCGVLSLKVKIGRMMKVGCT